MKFQTTIALFALVMAFKSLSSEVGDYFAQLSTFSADFSQTVVQDDEVVQLSTGAVQLKKPLKFRWDYQSPESMQLISDGQRFYHYDIALAQATSKPIEAVADTAIATLLNDAQAIDQQFVIRSLSDAQLAEQFPKDARQWRKQAKDFYLLRSTQVNIANSQASTVVLGFNGKQQLAVFYVADAYGENTFIFDNINQNATIEDAVFQFNPPADVDILE